MIINVRGTSGSGKSWVIKQLFGRFPVQPYDPAAQGHVLNGSTFVLGPYLTGLATEGTGVVNRRMTLDELQQVVRLGGGVDDGHGDLRRQDGVTSAVRAGERSHRNVIFESLLVSGIYSRWRDMAREVPDYRWVFLNTSLDKCLENVRAQRRSAGKPEEFNPKSTEDKYRAVRSVLAKARTDGLRVWDVSSGEAVDLIAGWIA